MIITNKPKTSTLLYTSVYANFIENKNAREPIWRACEYVYLFSKYSKRFYVIFRFFLRNRNFD